MVVYGFFCAQDFGARETRRGREIERWKNQRERKRERG
jgi:hypothetical protein